jgi:membrane-bound lytic murein transglycosylase D
MTFKKIILPFILLITISLGAQDNKSVVDTNLLKLSVLDSLKLTFVNHDNLAVIDSLWMKEMAGQDLSAIEVVDIEKLNQDLPVDYEFSTELFKERLQKLDAQSPFNIEYNVGLENIVKGFLKTRKNAYERLIGVSKYYFPLFEDQLAKYNIPLEVKYLAIVESALNPKAKSRVGATGIWQFMYATALNYDLSINSYIDERSDLIKSTEAACKYLSGMYKIFHDWDLVLASYNCGPGNVTKAIRRSGGKQNYWNIRKNLPQETAGYLPAFLASMYIFEFHKEHGINPKKAPVNYFATDTVLIKKEITFKQISKLIDIPEAELEFFNPSYKLKVIPFNEKSKNYLRLPVNKIAIFTSNEEKIYYYANYESNLREKQIIVNPNRARYVTRYKYYNVQKGDNLSEIASKYGVSVRDLKHWNRLRGNKAPKGRNLKIQYTEKVEPAVIAETKKPIDVLAEISSDTVNTETIEIKEIAPAKEKYTYKTEKIVQYADVTKNHKVKRGETLSEIADKHNVTINDIKKWNKIKTNTIAKGKILKIITNEQVVKTIRRKVLIDNEGFDNTQHNIEKNNMDLGYVYHTVEEGEEVFSLCDKFEITTAQLKKWNNLNNYNIKTGDKLIMYVPEAQEPDKKQQKKVLPKQITHTVKRGDTLSSIADKYSILVSELKKMNRIKSGKIIPGMKLKIRA